MVSGSRCLTANEKVNDYRRGRNVHSGKLNGHDGNQQRRNFGEDSSEHAVEGLEMVRELPSFYIVTLTSEPRADFFPASGKSFFRVNIFVPPPFLRDLQWTTTYDSLPSLRRMALVGSAVPISPLLCIW